MQSEWADLFIRYNKFWGGEPKEEDLNKIYTRKPRPPFIEVEHADGTKQKVWCTFDGDQIDIDVFAPIGLQFIEDQLNHLCTQCAPACAPSATLFCRRPPTQWRILLCTLCAAEAAQRRAWELLRGRDAAGLGCHLEPSA
jgi:hypothetical protein